MHACTYAGGNILMAYLWWDYNVNIYYIARKIKKKIVILLPCPGHYTINIIMVL